MKRILIGCEMSGRVREAFRAKGWDAWSCDILPSLEPGQHLQMDIFEAIAQHGPWDAGIFFPPCTYLSVSGMHRTVQGLRPASLTDNAIAFVERLWDCGIPRIAIENPVGVLSTRSKLGKPAQIVQPYQFGDDASKKTCLWLKGLPKLVTDPAQFIPGRLVEWPKGSGKMVRRWANQTDSDQNRLGPSEQRAGERAITYPGIARAMAEQWTF